MILLSVSLKLDVSFSWRQRRWMHPARRSWRTDFILSLKLSFRNRQWSKVWVLRRVHLASSSRELRLAG